MARKYKRTLNLYPAWSYQYEIEELDSLSEQGWQLVRGGAWINKFRKNTDVRYRYQIDYSGRPDDKGRYIETFREQGWEYIDTTFNGWSYFRKLWNPALPEDQYEIFTDQSSLREMTGRWIKIVSVLTAVITILLAIYSVCLAITPNLPNLIRVMIYLLDTAFLTYGIVRMKNTVKRTPRIWDRMCVIVFLVSVFVGLGCTTYLDLCRPHLNASSSGDYIAPISAEIDNSNMWISIDIPYTDNYFLDLGIKAGSPICVSILDDSNAVVYTVTETLADISRQKLHLQKGTYRFYFSDFGGGPLAVSIDIY